MSLVHFLWSWGKVYWKLEVFIESMGQRPFDLPGSETSIPVVYVPTWALTRWKREAAD